MGVARKKDTISKHFKIYFTIFHCVQPYNPGAPQVKPKFEIYTPKREEHPRPFHMEDPRGGTSHT